MRNSKTDESVVVHTIHQNLHVGRVEKIECRPLKALSNDVFLYTVTYSESGKKRKVSIVFKRYIDDHQYQDKMRREMIGFEVVSRFGIETPNIYYSDPLENIVIMEHIPYPCGLWCIREMLLDAAHLHASSFNYQNDRVVNFDKDAKSELVKNSLDALRRHAIISQRGATDILRRYEEVLSRFPETTIFCSRDFTPANCRMGDNGRLVYFDFERSGFAWPTDDVACLYIYSGHKRALFDTYKNFFRSNVEEFGNSDIDGFYARIEEYFSASIIEKSLEIAAFFSEGYHRGNQKFADYADVPARHINFLLSD